LLQTVPVLLSRNNADTTVLFVELDGAVTERKQRKVTTATNVTAGMELGSALTNNDAAGTDQLTAESLYTQILRVAVPTVSTT
jgi:hypothetical protein